MILPYPSISFLRLHQSLGTFARKLGVMEKPFREKMGSVAAHGASKVGIHAESYPYKLPYTWVNGVK